MVRPSCKAPDHCLPKICNERKVLYSDSGRSFSGEVSKAHHKCRVERVKSMREQAGAVQQVCEEQEAN